MVSTEILIVINDDHYNEKKYIFFLATVDRNGNSQCFYRVILLNYDLCKDKCNSQENGDKLRALKVKYFKFCVG